MPNAQIFGLGISSRARAVTAQRRVNVFYNFPRPGGEDRDGAGTRGLCSIFGRHGLRLFGDYGAQPARGWRVVPPYLYVVFGDKLCRIANDATLAELGTIHSAGGPAYLSENVGPGSQQVMVVDPSNGEAWNWQVFGIAPSTAQAAGTFAQIVAGGFLGARGVTYMNNRNITSVPGLNPLADQGWQISEVGDCTAWLALQSNFADSDSDQLVAVAGDHNILNLFGTRSTERWSDVGAAPFPYNRMPAATAQYGCAAPRSIVEFGDAGLALLAVTRDGTPVPALLTPAGFRELGDPDLAAEFERYADAGQIADAVGASYMAGGHRFFTLRFGAAGRTWAYDASADAWCEYTSFSGGVERNYDGALACRFGNRTLIASAIDGKVYVADSDAFDDAGAPILRRLVSRHLFQGGGVQTLDAVQFDMDEGNAAATGTADEVNPLCELRVSRDKGRTYGTPVQAATGPLGAYGTRVVFRRLGRANDLTLDFRYAARRRFVLTGEAASLTMGAARP